VAVPKVPHAFYYFLGLADDVDRVHHAMGAFLRRTLTEAATGASRDGARLQAG
jgi:hypothetical protein